jgi:hypothetical protein
MKYILLLLLVPQISFAELSSCGEYQVRAIVRAGKVGHEIVVNEKTKSELTLTMPIEERIKLAPYVGRAITAVVLLNTKFDGTKGEIDSIISIENRIPDPMNPADTGLKLIKQTECKKP